MGSTEVDNSMLLISVSLVIWTQYFMFADLNNTCMHEWLKGPFSFKLIIVKGQAYFSDLRSYIELVSLRMVYFLKEYIMATNKPIQCPFFLLISSSS